MCYGDIGLRVQKHVNYCDVLNNEHSWQGICHLFSWDSLVGPKFGAE